MIFDSGFGAPPSTGNKTIDTVVDVAADIDQQRAAGKTDGQIAVDLAERTAKANGASSSTQAAIGIAAAAAQARPHTQHPCPVADRWFDATKQYHGVDGSTWDQLTCSEKNEIMYGGVLGAQAIAVKRFGAQVVKPIEKIAGDVGKVIDAATKIFHF